MTAAPRCSDLAVDDARAGTAPPGDHWFLVEHPGPWGRVAFAQSGFGPAAVTAMDAWAREVGGRVLLIRRAGRATGGPRCWFRVDSRPGHEGIRTGTWTDDDGLVDALRSPGTAHTGPLFLTCAHGRHDTCCAVRGRPLAAALAAARPAEAWECSHVGGCRFAPSLVALPHGFAFGGMSPQEGVGIAAAYVDGRVDAEFLRGRSVHPPAVQAAQHHARLATGERGVDALALRSATSPSPGTWQVVLGGPEVVVEVRERRVEAGRPLTCSATAPGWMREFDLISVAAGG